MAELKLSAATWCSCPEAMDPAAYYGRLAEMGYGGVEMVPPERYDAARAAGLKLVNLLAPGGDPGLNRVEGHADLLPQLREAIQQAGEHGVGHVILFSGARQGQPDAEGIANCIRGVEQLVPDAEKAGVTLVFEMLNVNDHPDYQAERSEFGYQVVRGVGSPHVRVLYDIYHQVRTGEDPMETLVPNLEMVAHLHVAGSPKRDFPGADQDIDYASLVPAVQAAGYQGFWGMEFGIAGDPLEELAEAARLFRSHAEGGS